MLGRLPQTPKEFLPALLLLLGAALLLPPSALAQRGLKRTWTSDDGRPAEMELRSISGEIGTFLLPDDRKLDLPLARLTPADQKVAQDWWKSRPRPLEWPKKVEVETRTLEVQALPEEAREGWFLYRTEHFEFHSQAELTTSLVKDIARVFEATLKLVDTLPWGIASTPAEGDYHRAELYRSQARYVAAGGPRNSSGVYSPYEKKFMVPFESLGVKKVGDRYTRAEHYEVATLVHEITHQAMHFWLRFLPKWFVEGSAQFNEVIPYHYGKFSVDRIESGLKEFLENQGRSGLMSLGELFEMTHEEWATRSSSPLAQRQLYLSSLLLTYYFMHLDGDGDGARMRSYLKKVGGLKASWQNYSKAYEAYEIEFAVFLKKPGVTDNGDGSFTYPLNLTPPERPEPPFSEEVLEKAEFANLPILLDGRTTSELEAEVREKLKGIGVL